MDQPPKLVTHPLGLAGYALALVFGLIGKLGPSDRWPWLFPAAIALAAVSVVGGLLLARVQIQADAAKARAKQAPPSGPTTTTQVTTGDQSPAVSGTAGNVSVNYGDSKKK
jgi:hypothetical protein